MRNPGRLRLFGARTLGILIPDGAPPVDQNRPANRAQHVDLLRLLEQKTLHEKRRTQPWPIKLGYIHPKLKPLYIDFFKGRVLYAESAYVRHVIRLITHDCFILLQQNRRVSLYHDDYRDDFRQKNTPQPQTLIPL